MEKYCDLHVHSSLSDGDFTREEVIELAIDYGITTLAITDHNVPFLGEKEYLQAKYPNVRLISGSEVSAKILTNGNKYKEIHVIALDYDNTDEFVSFLNSNRINNRLYIESIINWLEKQGLCLDETYDSLKLKTKSQHIGRLLIAKQMVNKGLCKSIDEAFDSYIGNKPENDCPKPSIEFYADLSVVVDQIVRARGIPVLAHPLLYSFSDMELRKFLSDFRNLGGKGMEVYYGTYSDEERGYLLNLAKEYDLVPSAASDFHGHGHSGLNNRFPESIAQKLLSCKRC